MKSIYIILFVFIGTMLSAETYHLDPFNGDVANSGSITEPWSRLQDVIEAGLIKQYAYSPLPYDPSNNELIEKNSGIVVAGDTLLLYGGLHGEVFLRNYNNESMIFVIGKEDETPVIEKAQIQTGKNWYFENINFSSEPYDYYLNERLFFAETHGWQGPCSNIDVINCNFYSAEEPWDTAEDWNTKVSSGLYFFGDSMRAIGNTFENVNMALTCKGDYITSENNYINNFSGDGIRVLGSYGLYKGNMIKNCYNVNENHDDGIQSFTTGGLVVDNNILIENTIINTDNNERPLNGPLQGIGCFDGIYHNWEIINNVISVDHWHGITLLGADNCRIINNTVIDPTPDVTPGASWIRIADHKDGTPSTNCVVANNVANKFVIDAADINNVSLITYEEYDANFVDYWAADFRLLEESQLINAGSIEYSPETDIIGVPRLVDNMADVGAYEFQMPLYIHSADENKILVYPNPFVEQLTIKGIEVGYLRVYSAEGEEILKGLPSKVFPRMNQLQTGSYLMKISSNAGGDYFRWVVKQ